MVRMSAFGVGNAYKLRSVSVSVLTTPIGIEQNLHQNVTLKCVGARLMSVFDF